MEFPDTLDEEDMELYSKELKLAGIKCWPSHDGKRMYVDLDDRSRARYSYEKGIYTLTHVRRDGEFSEINPSR